MIYCRTSEGSQAGSAIYEMAILIHHYFWFGILEFVVEPLNVACVKYQCSDDREAMFRYSLIGASDCIFLSVEKALLLFLSQSRGSC